MRDIFCWENIIGLLIGVLLLGVGVSVFINISDAIREDEIKPGLQHCLHQIENAIKSEAPDYEALISCREGDAVIKFYNHAKSTVEMPELRKQ